MTTSVDWEDVIRAQGKCCACLGSLATSEHVNFVQLNKYTKWKYPAWGNVLALDPDKRESKRAMAILCDRCIEEGKSPLWAVEFRGEGEALEIRYHDVDFLEDAEPITEEDLRGGENIKEFDLLVPKAAEIHPMTYCVRDKALILTLRLKGDICCRCPRFVMNGGVCDPL